MIWDKNSQKKNQYNGIPIRNPYEDSSILDRYKDTTILLGLASPQANETVYEFLRENGYNNVFAYSKNGNNDVIDKLCTDNDKVEENCIQCGYAEACQKMINKNLQRAYGKHIPNGKKILDAVFLVITNRCTLNCKCCSQCTEQIIQTRSFSDITLEKLKRCMYSVLKEVAYIHQLTVSGGEALLCKELPEILEYLCELPEVGYIRFLTNGTIKMSEDIFNTLKNPKIICMLDDYGTNKNIPEVLYNNLRENILLLEKQNIVYSVLDNSDGTWYDLGDIEKREDKHENIRKNKECMFRSCLMISPNGNLSWCGRNVFSMECGLIPDDKRDYCDLSDEKDSQRVKEILELKYLHGCEYCGGTSHNNIVPAGMQIR